MYTGIILLLVHFCYWYHFVFVIGTCPLVSFIIGIISIGDRPPGTPFGYACFWALIPWHCAIEWIRPWLLHYFHEKVRWGPEFATFRTKTLNFTQVVHLTWLKKLYWGGPGPLWLSILLLIGVARVYCCTQNAKRNWRNNRLFVIGGISIRHGLAPAPPPPPAYAYAKLDLSNRR